MLRRTPFRLRSLLLMSSALVPSVAWSQGQLGESILMRSNTSVPVANTWYVDEVGNFVLMSEAQHHSYELAQLPAEDIPLQTLTDVSAGVKLTQSSV